MKEITLNNDPFTYNVGQDLNFVINFCDVAAEAKGVVDPNCETNHTLIYEYIDKCRISHKFVRNYFNPVEFTNNKKMSYLGENRLEIDFYKGVTPSNNFNIIENLATFYSNRIIDLSFFNFWDSSHLEHSFYASKFDGFTVFTNV